MYKTEWIIILTHKNRCEHTKTAENTQKKFWLKFSRFFIVFVCNQLFLCVFLQKYKFFRVLTHKNRCKHTKIAVNTQKNSFFGWKTHKIFFSSFALTFFIFVCFQLFLCVHSDFCVSIYHTLFFLGSKIGNFFTGSTQHPYSFSYIPYLFMITFLLVDFLSFKIFFLIIRTIKNNSETSKIIILL